MQNILIRVLRLACHATGLLHNKQITRSLWYFSILPYWFVFCFFFLTQLFGNMWNSCAGREFTEGTHWFWNLPDFYASCIEKWCITKLRGSPKVNLLSVAWNGLHKRQGNSISCKWVSTIKGNWHGRQVCLANRPRIFCPFLLDVWQLLRYKQISLFSISTHVQKTQNLSVIMQQTHYQVYSIWIHFDELYVIYFKPDWNIPITL